MDPGLRREPKPAIFLGISEGSLTGGRCVPYSAVATGSLL